MGGDAFSMHSTVPRSPRWPWVLAVTTMVIFLATNAVASSGDIDLPGLIDLATLLAFLLVGALLCSRVPGNVVGPLLLGSGVTLATTISLSALEVVAMDSGRVPVTVVAAAGLVSGVGFLVPVLIVLVGIPLVFPDGRLLSGRWRWVVVLCVVAVSSAAVSQLVGPDPVGRPQIANPFLVPTLAGLADVLETFTKCAVILGFGAGALAIVIRYRRDDDVERHQLKWLIAPPVLAAVAFPIAFLAPWQVVSDVAFAVGLLALLALPLAIGVAILRYHVYDIDRIISRSIAWALITGLLVGSFAVIVVGLQAVLVRVTQGDVLAVAASTLVAFALFQPVRRTVQGAVDRRFDRARYDSDRTAEAFSTRVRSEVDLDAVADDLTGSVRRALRPQAMSLWLKGPGR
jgi:hypothetical protein